MTAISAQQKPTKVELACDDSILTVKTLETVAREIERQMYGQWNHCAIYESDLQRLCPDTGLAEMARATERLDRGVDAIKKQLTASCTKCADPLPMSEARHCDQILPRKDKRGVDLISDALPFGRLWYDGPSAASNAIGYAKLYS